VHFIDLPVADIPKLVSFSSIIEEVELLHANGCKIPALTDSADAIIGNTAAIAIATDSAREKLFIIHLMQNYPNISKTSAQCQKFSSILESK
jgi:hypothetical protein